MDPALLRERELFKKRALAQPVVEKKKKEPDVSSSARDDSKKKSKPGGPSSSAPKMDVNYKTMSGSSMYKFGVLAKIVKFMRSRHQVGDDHPLSLEEILDETNQLDVGTRVKQWLLSEALVDNPKIEVSPEGTFCFKAAYRIRDKKSLLRLLKQHDLKGLGGIMVDDVEESVPHCDKVLKGLKDEIIFINRPMDKKRILFYNDKTASLQVDEDFQKLWRSVAVESMDDQKIDEYLEKQGIKSMQDHGLKKLAPHKRKANNRKKTNKKPRDNDHLADVLENYDDK